MAQFPAMPLWTDAYLADTGHLTTLEHGAYLLLLLTMWRAGGSLPDDDARLMRFTKLNGAQWAKIKPTIMEFFHVEDGRISQKRLAHEYEFVKQKREKASQSAKSKYLKSNEQAEANAEKRKPNAHAPTPTPTPDNKKPPSEVKKGSRIPDDFEPDLDAAVELGLRPEKALMEAAAFKDYWRAKTGKDATKLDWPGTWRNWVRRAVERQGGPRGSPARGRTAFREHQDAITENLERMANGTGTHNQRAFDLEPAAYQSDRSSRARK